MFEIYNISAINANILISGNQNGLSEQTIRKLKSLGIDPKTVSSEIEAQKLIEEKENPKYIKTENKISSEDKKLENLYKRLKALALELGIVINENQKIPDILDKIHNKITELENKTKGSNSDFNAIKSEYESVKLSFNNIIAGKSPLLSEMDVLSQNNRAVHRL